MSDANSRTEASSSGVTAGHDRRAGPVRIAHALCVHGAGGGAWEWALWRAVFDAHAIECAAIDLQPTDAGLAATGLDHYLAQVRIALNALPRPRAVVGASLGGLLALACADDADAVVLVNPLPPVPWASRLPPRVWPEVVRWGMHARLASTRRALFDADAATAIEAMRRWRDESGRVLREAHAGREIQLPRSPMLCIASGRDDDIPPELTVECAREWSAELVRLPEASHVGPLLGRDAAHTAARVVAWLQAQRVQGGKARAAPR